MSKNIISPENILQVKKAIKTKKINADLKIAEQYVGYEKIRTQKNLVILILTLILYITVLIIGLYYQITNNIFLWSKNALAKEAIASGNESDEYIIDRFDNCRVIEFGSFDIICHPLAFILMIFYAFLIKRRIFAPGCCRKLPGLPSVISPFKKTKRLYSSVVYCVVAYDVFTIIESILSKTNSADNLARGVYDPSGLYKFSLRVLEVIVVALRYYPILITFKHSSIVMYITSAIYSYISFALIVYNEGFCDGYDGYGSVTEIEFDVLNMKLGFRISKIIIQFWFGSLLSSLLTVNAIQMILERIKSKSSNEKIKKNEFFFSIYDLKHCQQLFKKPDTDNGKKMSKFVKLKEKLINWQENFRFSSRVINTHVTAYISLYYFLVTILDYTISLVSPFIGKEYDVISQFIPLDADLDIKFPTFYIRNEYLMAFIFPPIVSYIICLVQTILGLRSIKQNLLKMYKGEYTSVIRKMDMSNMSISISQLKFGGFVVGYLIWGFVLLFYTLLMISIIIILAINFLPLKIFKDIILTLVPIITVLIVKKIIDILMGRFVFLQDYGKTLGIDNYGLFTIYSYVIFFLDSFMGSLSAIIRIIKSVIASLIYMPRIGYCVMGNHLAAMDPGYQSYSGFLHMEVVNTHPVLVSFCALLFIRNLQENQNDQNIDDSKDGSTLKVTKKRKKAIIKWFVAYTLIHNPNLLHSKKRILNL